MPSIKILLLSVLFLLAFSCRSKRKPQPAPVDYAAKGYVKAEIKKYDVAGCGFMLFLENGKKLNPSNLPEHFKAEGKKVWVTYSVKKGTVSICMAGEIVQVSDIVERTD